MINFEEELERYKPIMVVKDVEQEVKSRDLTDMVDLLKEMTLDGRGFEGMRR